MGAPTGVSSGRQGGIRAVRAAVGSRVRGPRARAPPRREDVSRGRVYLVLGRSLYPPRRSNAGMGLPCREEEYSVVQHRRVGAKAAAVCCWFTFFSVYDRIAQRERADNVSE
uniref:Rpr117U.2 n=1 Tax=Hordeum vulgare subsp. vulgare TaxID=112509 RepID=A2T576_HORVV|nr:Rpr117U.2 [Hordeum vulgare subsp. vulgare]ABN04094.1 Rpr117U.2 [Hordeum vulgare subsp. vulgare]ABN04100.1 Rpr117U.2 [Hordeum vulgare subsp. vulgare]ABN04105.1 Rpr117U.2 [Hordeum vulgare subsp. vulgare]